MEMGNTNQNLNKKEKLNIKENEFNIEEEKRGHPATPNTIPRGHPATPNTVWCGECPHCTMFRGDRATSEFTS